MLGGDVPQSGQRRDGNIKQPVGLGGDCNSLLQKYKALLANLGVILARLLIDTADLAVGKIHRILLFILPQTAFDFCCCLLRVSAVQLLLDHRIHNEAGGHTQLILLRLSVCCNNNSAQQRTGYQCQQEVFYFLLHLLPPITIYNII